MAKTCPFNEHKVCTNGCALNSYGKCAFVHIWDSVAHLNQTLFDTLGSGKTGFALDAVCDISNHTLGIWEAMKETEGNQNEKN